MSWSENAESICDRVLDHIHGSEGILTDSASRGQDDGVPGLSIEAESWEQLTILTEVETGCFGRASVAACYCGIDRFA